MGQWIQSSSEDEECMLNAVFCLISDVSYKRSQSVIFSPSLDDTTLYVLGMHLFAVGFNLFSLNFIFQVIYLGLLSVVCHH